MTPEPLDLRLTPAALAAWTFAAVGLGWSPGRAVLGALLLLVGGAATMWIGRRQPAGPGPAARRRSVCLAVTAAAVVGAGALGAAGLRAGAVQVGPVANLATQRAQVGVTGVVTSDPVRREGELAPYVLVRLTVNQVVGRGVVSEVRSPVLVLADESWLDVDLGDQVRASGRLSPSLGPDLSAVLMGDADPEVTQRASRIYRGISQVRAGIHEAVTPLAVPERALIPALVDGDDAGMPEDVAADFTRTGLTHLLAVSGSNLTLVLGFVLFVAKWCGVRGRGIAVVGMCSVAFFVLLARPEPSVLRAAAMGLVAIAGLSAGGRRKGVRALCVAVVTLVLLDPWLARSTGFLLSSLATAGILLLAPAWRDALAQWMPRVLAEAIAVPLAAQLVCTPVIAVISGQVSLVAVLSNVLVAPAVGPTTVLGLVAGIVAMVSAPLGHLGGRLAGVPAWWIITVARRTADLDGASVEWPVGPVALVALTGLCLVVVVGLGWVLRRGMLCVAVSLVLVFALVSPVGRLGWPPADWLMVMCDVGQGDGMVLNAGHGVAVVVDTGPDPAAMGDCLDELGITQIALVVLTHFHADHVDGLSQVLAGRSVAEIEVSPLADPADRADDVRDAAAAAGVPVTVAVAGEKRTIGQLSWSVLGPQAVPEAGSSAGGEGSAPNNASIVMRVEVSGHTLLLSGDAEPEEEDDILDTGANLDVEVLKVAHHGSANQEPEFVLDTHALLAVISVGADNDYGHPAPETLALLQDLGAHVYRTDQDGDIAIVDRLGQLAVVTSKG